MKPLTISILLLAAAAPLWAGDAPTVADLQWLSGRWIGVNGQTTIEEAWLQPAGGTMVGVNRSVADGRTVGYEFLRIVEDDRGVVYLASPGGRQPPTAFILTECEGPRAVFANPEHDFPQRISYWRDGDALHARIEGTQNGKTTFAEWSWQRTVCD